MYLVVALYGLAMLLMPLAHRPLNLGQSPDLSAFALPDGTIPDLCTTAPGKGGKPGGRSTVCDACLLTCAPGLVIAGLEVMPVVASAPVRLGSRFQMLVVARRFVTAARPRAPPHALA
jgi:hypothetical protein